LLKHQRFTPRECGFRTIVITDFGIVISHFGNVIKTVSAS